MRIRGDLTFKKSVCHRMNRVNAALVRFCIWKSVDNGDSIEALNQSDFVFNNSKYISRPSNVSVLSSQVPLTFVQRKSII